VAAVQVVAAAALAEDVPAEEVQAAAADLEGNK